MLDITYYNPYTPDGLVLCELHWLGYYYATPSNFDIVVSDFAYDAMLMADWQDAGYSREYIYSWIDWFANDGYPSNGEFVNWYTIMQNAVYGAGSVFEDIKDLFTLQGVCRLLYMSLIFNKSPAFDRLRLEVLGNMGHNILNSIFTFANGNGNVKAYYISRVGNQILLTIIGTKGAQLVTEISTVGTTAEFSEAITMANGESKIIYAADETSEMVAEAEVLVESAMGEISTTNIVNKTAEEMNSFWSRNGCANPPYKANTVVKEFELSQQTNFVRVYDGVHSLKEGGWVIKAEDIVGLTAQQIKDKFALQYLPTYICDVEMDAGATMHCGVAGEISGWGSGGGIQFDLNADKTVGNFINQRLIP